MSEIVARGIRVHNLKSIDVRLPCGRLVAVTGVSGSGKSSLAFDTFYAEGQRRYVESLSSYVRQFLERMERPDVDSMTGILPAIAIESKNVITNARSTVGTQTELLDYLRILFARAGETRCSGCSERVREQPAGWVASALAERYEGRRARICFAVSFAKVKAQDRKTFLGEFQRQGFLKVRLDDGRVVDLRESAAGDLEREDSFSVIADELTLARAERGRIAESIETAYRFGKGKLGVDLLDEEGRSTDRLAFSEGFHCPRCDRSCPKPTPQLFSFNSPLGACPTCQGFGRVITIDPNLVVPDAAKSLAQGAIEPWTRPSARWEWSQLKSLCKRRKIPWHTPWRELSGAHRKLIFEGESGYFSVNEFFAYLEKRIYKMHVRVFLSRYRNYVPCPACATTRLKPEALQVRVSGKSIAELSALPLDRLLAFFRSLDFDAEAGEKVQAVLDQIRSRLTFLVDIGLGYLTLSRLSRTLSGGESQRINLAASLGSALVDTLYVLDEPSVGLHERDNQLLIAILRQLKALGNTILVVEHDKTMIRSADEVVDLGPGAGEQGGEVVYQGPLEGLLADARSITAKYLRGELRLDGARSSVTRSRKDVLSIEGAREHNLKDIAVEIPLHCFCVVSGVSGSGKSSLLEDVLYANYLRWRGRPVQEPGAVRHIAGLEKLDDMIVVDRSAIGRTPRSNALTYMKAFDEVRKVFARTHEARIAGLTPGDFSFNAKGGRCEKCEGQGKIKVEMHFLADLYVTCEACRGTRYQDRVLAVHHKGRSIDGVFKLTVDEALEFFKGEGEITRRLTVLSRVGLGYLALGQVATTLSQGEAQRLKLALELLERPASHILYLFDEPTTGLHDHDIRYLLDAFRELLNAGHSIVVIEHNLDVIRCADWVIDLGPEGGEAGGSVVAVGTPQEVARVGASHTGRFLAALLAGREPQAISLS